MARDVRLAIASAFLFAQAVINVDAQINKLVGHLWAYLNLTFQIVLYPVWRVDPDALVSTIGSFVECRILLNRQIWALFDPRPKCLATEQFSFLMKSFQSSSE